MRQPQGTLIGDGYCKVTVVGARKRADLALPARTPIAEYITSVARLVEQPEPDDALPPAWSLAPAGEGVLSPAASLAAAEVLDGTVLYLRDAAGDESYEPVVLEIDEQVGAALESLGGRAWDRPRRAAAALCVGVLWLSVVAAASALSLPHAQALTAALIGLVAGIAATAVASAARVHGWPLAPALRVCVAACAIPDLAFCASRLGPAHATAGQIAVDTAVGALIGTAAVLAASPGVLTTVLPGIGLIALITTLILGMLHATSVDAAAAVTVLCIVLGALAPWSVGRFAMFSAQGGRGAEGLPAEAVAALVGRAHRLLVFVNIQLSAAAGVAMVVLAHSPDRYAAALSGCAAVALLARSGRFRLTTEALPGVLAAAAGIAACLWWAPAHLNAGFWAGPGAGPSAAAAAGALAVLVGVGLVLRRSRRQGERKAWQSVVAGLCSIACVPLAVGVFGVYHHLVTVGHHI